MSESNPHLYKQVGIFYVSIIIYSLRKNISIRTKVCSLAQRYLHPTDSAFLLYYSLFKIMKHSGNKIF